MSGVARLRAAKKGGGTLAIEHVSQPEGRNGSAKDCAEALTAPTKPAGAVWKAYPTTDPPTGNESPHRGEHP